MGKVYVFREFLLALGMEVGTVAHVDEIGLAGSNAQGKSDGLIDTLVRGMWLYAQSTHNEGVESLQFTDLTVRDMGKIGQISHRPNTKTDDGQLPVEHTNRPYARAPYIKGGVGCLKVYLVHREVGSSRVGVICETIEEVATYGGSHIGFGTDLHRLEH